jgi:cell division protease FtsH
LPVDKIKQTPPGLKFNVFYLLLAITGILLFRDLWGQYNQIVPVPYSQFEKWLDDNNIEEISITNERIYGTLKKPMEKGQKQFVTVRVEENLAKKLAQHDLKYTGVIESHFFTDLLSWLLPIFLFFGLWVFLMRRMAGGGGIGGQLMSIGKSRAKVYVETDTKVRFSDVAGVDEGKSELQEVVNFLKAPDEFGKLGARMPKGVLLVGPPGTGKTLLAKAVAGEANVPFFSISGSEFVEMFVGVGAARVRDLFEQARQKAPAIIFIDELDALGRARGSGFAGGHDEKEQTLNQLLVELDGFDSKSGLVLLAATNRPEILDPALLRAGRFDRQILVDKPDRKGRSDILKVHARKIKLDDSVDLDQIAALTPGFTGADLANLVNEAALVATRKHCNAVSMDHFTQAIERIIAGLEKRNRLLNERERKVVAFHEMGHALVAAGNNTTDRVHKVSIIPRGIGSLGYTIQRPTEDRYLLSKKELLDKMMTLMGGRAAEIIIFGEISTGAADDIDKATNIAREMVTRYGMDEHLGHATYDAEPKSMLGAPGAFAKVRNYSEESARKIDEAVQSLVDGALDAAASFLKANIEVLTSSARLLLERESLDETELKPYFDKVSGQI